MDNPLHITKTDIKFILNKSGYKDATIENYIVCNTCDKMLGYLADYVKLQIFIKHQTSTSQNEIKMLCFFIKAIPRTNTAKAKIVREMRVFETELHFYDVIKNNMEVPDMKPWCAKFIARLDDAIVFEDLTAMRYKVRSRHVKFDRQHTLQALDTLARFHATTIIFEEKKTKVLKRAYRINDEYEPFLNKAGYIETDPWFFQCKTGTLEAVKRFSKYRHDEQVMKIIQERWCDVFNHALTLCNASLEHRSVICHRDLWNNNILFRYPVEGKSEPDDCVFVDFQTVCCQPPAGDVMFLLHCNLDSQFRKSNLNSFLHYYYDKLESVLQKNNIKIEDIATRDQFMKSAVEQNLWGLITHACLVQTFWLDDDMMTKISSDSAQYVIVNTDKATFITTMMEKNEGYKKAVMEVLEEVVTEYCLRSTCAKSLISD